MAYFNGPKPRNGKSFAVWTDSLIQCYDGFTQMNNGAWPDEATTYVATGSAARNGDPQLEGTGTSEAHYMNFDGTGDYFLFEDYTNSNPATCVAWVNTSSGNTQSICSHVSGGPVNMSFEIRSGKMYYRYYDGQWREVGGGGTTINNGAWHQLVWARSGTDHKFYVDGSLDQDLTMNSSMSGRINSIGCKWGAAELMLGKIAHFAMYNVQLSAHQVSVMFKGQRRRFGV